MIKKILQDTVDVFDWLNDNLSPVMALDTETDGVHYGCNLKGVSITNGINVCYINLDNNIQFSAIISVLKTIIPTIELLVMHHAVFDLRVLKSYGIDYEGKIFCTMVGAHLLNENKKCGLKELAKRILKVPDKEINSFENSVKFGYSSDKFFEYATNDVIWTFMLYEKEFPLLKSQGLYDLFNNIEMPFQYVLVDLFNSGIKLDTNKLNDFKDILLHKKSVIEANMLKSIGKKYNEERGLFGFITRTSPINLNSDQQLADIIQDELGINLPKTSPSKTYPNGQPSTAEEALLPLRNNHKFIELILQYRKIEKILNTFIIPMEEHIHKDGRIRTSFNDTVARTGRLSSSSPNLQNIPKELSEDDIINVRELFVAKDGYVFVQADYDSQELRQLANVTGDKSLIRAFKEDIDLHLLTANNCLNLGIEEKYIIKTNPEFKELKEKYKKERHIGKNGINFPIVYGSTAYGISKNNNVSEEEAQGWLDAFFKSYPEVKNSIDKCRRQIFERRFVSNYFGRRRRFLELSDKSVRQGFNFWIQGFCADLLRLTLVNLLNLYKQHPEWDARLVLTVHDDCITECKEEYAEQVKTAKKEVMENAVNFPVKFLVDIKICRSYGE